jgi:ATP-dependent exoDNAse (exonuclease V) alpha subunit
MATFFFELKSLSRREGRSITAASAYRSASAIHHPSGELHDYRKRSGVLAAVLLTPPNAPAGLQTRQEVFSAAELAEKRKDAKVAREIVLALPHELAQTASKQLAMRFGEWLVERYGIVVDVAVHAPSRHGDERNLHAHLLMTTRVLGTNGFGEKTRQLDTRRTAAVEVELMRKTWAEMLNQSLAEARLSERVDHRSYARRGISKIGEPKVGVTQTALERKGVCTPAGDERRRIRRFNDDIARCERQIKALQATPAIQERADPPQRARAERANVAGRL